MARMWIRGLRWMRRDGSMCRVRAGPRPLQERSRSPLRENRTAITRLEIKHPALGPGQSTRRAGGRAWRPGTFSIRLPLSLLSLACGARARGALTCAAPAAAARRGPLRSFGARHRGPSRAPWCSALRRSRGPPADAHAAVRGDARRRRPMRVPVRGEDVRALEGAWEKAARPVGARRD